MATMGVWYRGRSRDRQHHARLSGSFLDFPPRLCFEGTLRIPLAEVAGWFGTDWWSICFAMVMRTKRFRLVTTGSCLPCHRKPVTETGLLDYRHGRWKLCLNFHPSSVMVLLFEQTDLSLIIYHVVEPTPNLSLASPTLIYQPRLPYPRPDPSSRRWQPLPDASDVDAFDFRKLYHLHATIVYQTIATRQSQSGCRRENDRVSPKETTNTTT